MKKYIIALALALSTMGAKAQTILLGDANGDGVITMADVTATVDILLGKSTPKTASCVEKFVRDNSITGTYNVDDVAKSFKNGYELVDLALPSKTYWSATNLGALTPSEAGTPAEGTVTLPEGWSLPTAVQIQELKDNCTITEDGNCLKIANRTDATKYILVPKSTPNLLSQDGTAFTLIQGTTVTTVYVRPVSGTTGSGTEIGQGDDNGELESKPAIFTEE